MKNILHIIPSLKSGGAELYCIELCNYLAKCNFNVTILTTERTIKKVFHPKIVFRYYDVSSKNPIKVLNAVKFLCDMILQAQINVIHTHSRIPAIITYLSLRKSKKGIKFINSLHGLYKSESDYEYLYNKFALSSDLLISVSTFGTRFFYNSFLLGSRRNLITINSGINLDYYNEKITPERLLATISKLNIDPEIKLLIMPGRLTKQKGHIFLLEGLRQINRSDYKCIIVGDMKKKKSYASYVIKKIKEFNLDQRVQVLDNIDDIQALYLLSYCTIALSLEYESFGRVPIESAAIGRPTIATNIGPFKDNVIHNKTGWLVDPYNVHDLGVALNTVLDLDSAEWERMSKFCTYYAKKYFSNVACFEKIVDVYNGM